MTHELTPEAVRAAVDRYFTGTRSMDGKIWASAFAENAVVEDPVGQPALTSPAAILAQGEGFVSAFRSIGLEAQFVETCGNEAVAYWIGRGIRLDGQAIECEGINVFQFDPTGQITNLRGFWNPGNMRVVDS